MDLERGNLSRRGFLQQSLTGLAAVGLPVWFAKELVADAEQDKAKKQKTVPPGEIIVMGHIGCGNPMNGRGRDIANQALRTNAIRYAAICDVDRVNRDAFAEPDTAANPESPSLAISVNCWPGRTSPR